MPDARELLEDALHDRCPVEVLAAVAIAVDGEQHLRFDLRETVDDAAGAELRRRARPDGADRGYGQKGDQRLGDIGHVGNDPIAALHAEGSQPAGRRGDELRELAPAQLIELAQLRAVQHGHGRRIAIAAGAQVAEHVLGVVQLRALEPARPRHLTRAEHALIGPGEAHAREVPDRGPEVLELIDRPLPQLAVVGKGAAAALPGPAHEARHLDQPAIGR